MKHPHHSLIMQWAADPEAYIIMHRPKNTILKWKPVQHMPTWSPDMEYMLELKAAIDNAVLFKHTLVGQRFRFKNQELAVFGICQKVHVPPEHWPNQRSTVQERLFCVAEVTGHLQRVPLNEEVEIVND